MTSRLTATHGIWTLGLLCSLIPLGCSRSEPPAAPPPTDLQAPAAQPDAAPAAAAEDETAALIDGHAITVAELRTLFDQYVGPYRHQIPPEQMDTFWQAQMPGLLETAIAQRLVREAIRQAGIEIAADAIDRKLGEISGQIPEGQTLEELTGRTGDEIRGDIREMLSLEQLMADAGLAVAEPTDPQVQAYYVEHKDEFQMPETVRARHILLKVDADAEPAVRDEKRATIDALRAQLLDGADFAALATDHSDCPSRQRGGDLGAFGRGQMVPPFEEAAFGQELDAIGEVVETQFGYHIIQVMQRDTARDVPLDEVRAQIIERLQNESRRDHYNQMLKQLRANADIQYLLP